MSQPANRLKGIDADKIEGAIANVFDKLVGGVEFECHIKKIEYGDGTAIKAKIIVSGTDRGCLSQRDLDEIKKRAAAK